MLSQAQGMAAEQASVQTPAPAQQTRPMPEETQDQGMYPWEEEASEEEQAALEAAVDSASDYIYTNEQSHQGILKMVANAASPEEGYVEAVSTVITELDKQMELPVSTISALAMEVFNMVDDIASASGAVEMDDQQAQMAMAGVQDAINRMYGLEEQELEGIAETLSDEDVQQLKTIYEGATNGQGFAA